jgi:hypothetical protein
MPKMTVGMLWFDGNRKQPLAERIQRAASFYHEKYGDKPNLCFVHPQTLNGGEIASSEGVTLRTSSSVLPDHFWLGVDSKR